MEDTKPVIPTLHARSNPILTDIREQAAYTIRWFFANPGRTSTVNEAEMTSFRKLNARFGKVPSDLCEKVAESLRLILIHYDAGVRVTCDYKMEDKINDDGSLAGTYRLEISVMGSDGRAIIPGSMIKINNKGDTIDCQFQ